MEMVLEKDVKLKSLAKNDYVNNVVIFISDSLRYDYVPQCVSEKGVLIKTIAASTGTSTSLPAITSGKYPWNSDVWSIYKDTFEEPIDLAKVGDFGFNSENSWHHLESHEKPPLMVHDLKTEKDLNEMREPFVYIVLDKGPHQPYDALHSNYDEFRSFYRDYQDNLQEMRKLYAERAKESSVRFLNLIKQVRSHFDLDNTLMVFTSDHGELLGEQSYGCLFKHHSPLVPELIEVPTVLIGGGLPENQKLKRIISSVDISATLLGALNDKRFERVDGKNYWDNEIPSTNKGFTIYNYRVRLPSVGRKLDLMRSIGVFEYHGGYVHDPVLSINSLGVPIMVNLIGDESSPATRHHMSSKNLYRMLKSYRPGMKMYGEPNSPYTDYKNKINQIQRQV